MSSIDNIARQYRGLCLSAIAEQLETLLSQAEAHASAYLQFAESRVAHEQRQRKAQRIEQNRKRAGFPLIKSLEEFDDRFQTTISTREVNSLLDFGFIDNRDNAIFIGPPGVGQTHLAIGIGLNAIDAGYKVSFNTALGLMETVEIAELKGELKKNIHQRLKFDVLIIDELGYLPMNKQGMPHLFQLIHARYEYRSVSLTTNKEFTHWGSS